MQREVLSQQRDHEANRAVSWGEIPFGWLQYIALLMRRPIRYGLLPPRAARYEAFDLGLSITSNDDVVPY